MKILLNPAFLIVLFLFLIHQIIEKGFGIAFPFFDNYLDPFLCTPILLTLFLYERRVIFGFGKNYILSFFELIIATLLFILTSELLFPYLSSQFTSDWRDIIGLSLGAVYFYFFINRRNS